MLRAHDVENEVELDDPGVADEDDPNDPAWSTSRIVSPSRWVPRPSAHGPGLVLDVYTDSAPVPGRPPTTSRNCALRFGYAPRGSSFSQEGNGKGNWTAASLSACA